MREKERKNEESSAKIKEIAQSHKLIQETTRRISLTKWSVQDTIQL